jgi:hypothetical protein
MHIVCARWPPEQETITERLEHDSLSMWETVDLRDLGSSPALVDELRFGCTTEGSAGSRERALSVRLAER